MERDMILERMREGKAVAKRRNPNFKEGRPVAKKTPKKKLAYDLLKSGLSYKLVSEKTGLSKSTLQRIKKMYEI